MKVNRSKWVPKAGFRALMIGLLLGFTVSLITVPSYSWSLREAAEPYKGLTITIGSPVGEMDNGVKLAAAEFLEETGIKVRNTPLPYSALYEKFLTAAIGGTGAYDMLMIDTVWCGTFMGGGYMEPLAPYRENPKLVDPDYDMDDHIATIRVAYGEWQGVQYALPYYGAATTFFYRKDLFEESGLTVPTNWEEWEETAKVLTRDTDGDGRIDFWATGMPAAKDPAPRLDFESRLWSLGGDWVDRTTWEVLINSAIGLEAMEMWLRHIKNYSPPDSIGWGHGEPMRAFAEGRFAMVNHWPQLAYIASDPAQSKIVGKVGYGKALKEIRESASVLGGWGVGISTDSNAKEASFLFLQYLTSKELDKRIFLEAGVGLSRISNHLDPEIHKIIDPDYFASHLHSLSTGFMRPRIAEYMEMNEKIMVKLTEVYTEEMSPKEALDTVAEEWRRILIDAGKLKPLR